MQQKNIAIIGATGFTGSELVRILHHHPDVHIAMISSESRAGEKFSDVHPFFQGIVDMPLVKAADIANHDIDLAFLALPHGVSMEYVSQFQQYDFPIVDLSGDFRLSGPAVYEEWYGKTHSFTEGFAGAAYGIPELFFEEIHRSRLIANPGCYPTSVILAVAPLLKAGLARLDSIIADSKSGVTGAGVKSKPVNHFSNVNDNFKAYGLKNHRHSIEIQEKLSRVSGKEATVQFTPHLLPIDRGILSTIYLKPGSSSVTEASLRKLYEEMYEGAPFVRMRDSSPSVKAVRGTNFCDIHVSFDARTQNIIVVSAIDNLVKGAAGQAVQNMNVLFGWKQDRGLKLIPLSP